MSELDGELDDWRRKMLEGQIQAMQDQVRGLEAKIAQKRRMLALLDETEFLADLPLAEPGREKT